MLSKTFTTNNLNLPGIKEDPQPTILAIYRQNMPSPRARSTPIPDIPLTHSPDKNNDSNASDQEDTDEKDKASTLYSKPYFKKIPNQHSFQRSDTLFFTSQNKNYELRCGDFVKHLAELLEVSNVADLVQYYIQLQGMSVT